MAIPVLAVPLGPPMDPSDLIEYEVDFGELVLGDDEDILDYALALGPEGAVVGLSILSDGLYAPQVVEGTVIRLWFEVEPASRENPDFMAGVDVPITCTITTTSVPSRRWQRTVVLRMQQQ